MFFGGESQKKHPQPTCHSLGHRSSRAPFETWSWPRWHHMSRPIYSSAWLKQAPSDLQARFATGRPVPVEKGPLRGSSTWQYLLVFS